MSGLTTDSPSSKRQRVDPSEAILAQLSQSQGDVDSPAQGKQTDISAVAARRFLQTSASSAQWLTGPEYMHGPEDANHELDSIISNLSTVTRLCDQKFVTFSFDSIPAVWRAIYIDAQLAKACCAVRYAVDRAKEGSAVLRRGIRDLDLALIIAGAGSTSKGKHCHDLIAALQLQLRADETEPASQTATVPRDSASARQGLGPARQEAPRRLPSPSTQADSLIREFAFHKAPSFMDLAEQSSSVCARPFIARAYAQGAGWPAVQSEADGSAASSWSSIERLLRIAGPARVVPVEVGANYARKEWGQDVMLWSDFLRQCRWDEPIRHDEATEDPRGNDSSSAEPLVLYMAQHDLTSQFPDLESDFALPDYVYTSPPAPQDWPEYTPPSTAAGVVTNLWIGPAGTVSPPHFDPYYNCFVQAVGYKEVWVAPPHCRPHKAPASCDQKSAADNAASIADSLMSNTANIDVFDARTHATQAVRAAASKAVLGPGDLLYMPPGWWHSLRSLSKSFSVSTWF